MPRFSLKRMLHSVTLLSVGIALFVYCFSVSGPPNKDPPFLVLLAATSVTGAGIFMPFGRPIFGALLGFFGLFLVALIIILRHPAM